MCDDAPDVRAEYRTLLVLSVALGCACGSKGSVPPAASSRPAATDGTDSVVVAHGETFHARLFAFELGDVALEVHDAGMHAALPPLDKPAERIALNGGFFDEKGRARGLVVSHGEMLSPFDRALSGGVLTVDGGRAALTETESFDPASRHEFAVQCRPRLVVGGKVNIRSDDGQRAERTVLCLRKGGSELVLGTLTTDSGGPSLLAAADALYAVGCEDALNLDGGPSTTIAWRDADGVHGTPPRGAIRHAIVVSSATPATPH
jgi:hypothetical protein